jgi:outer membrane beta-barrel protein
MRRNVAIFTAAVLALVLVMAESREAVAQEIVLEGPLVGQPAVRKLMLLRKGRLSIAPNIGFTLVDDFRRNIILGGKLEYNILDWLSIGVWGGYSLGVETQLTDEIKAKARSNRMNLPRHNHIGDQIGKMNWITTLQLNVIPFRGKIARFSKVFLQADIYLFFGGGVAGVEDRGYAADDEAQEMYNLSMADPTIPVDPAFKPPPVGVPVPCADIYPNDGMADDYNRCLTMESRVTFVPTFGGGVTLFVNKWMSLNIEYRAIPFRINKSGTDEVGMNKNRQFYKDGSVKKFNFPNHVINNDDRVWHFNHSLQISYSFYFNFSGPGVFQPSVTD